VKERFYILITQGMLGILKMGNMRGKALTPSGIKCSLQGNSRMDPVLKMENSMITRIKKSLIQTTKSEK